MNPLIEVEAVRFAYEATAVIDGVGFTVEPGEILAVIGPNSAGKTTLLRLLSKVVSPQSGRIRLAGKDLAVLRRLDVARTVAVVPQDLTMAFPFTVREFVLMGRYPHTPGRFFEGPADLAAAGEALKTAGVAALADKRVDTLSGGERQRVLLARAVAQKPNVLLMDEPNAHLDLHHQVALAQLIRRLNRDDGTTILLVSHDLGLAAELSDRLLLLHRGRVVRLGKPWEVLEANLLASVYGCALEVRPGAGGRPRVEIQWKEGGEN